MDVKFEQDEYGRFDIVIENNKLAVCEGFDTAIWMSLFTDARANDSQVAVAKYRRGWMGDTVSLVKDRKLGSHLWLLEQRRLNNTNLNNAIDWTRKCLQWLIEDGKCTEIVVTGKIIPKLGIELTIDIFSHAGKISTNNIQLWKITGE